MTDSGLLLKIDALFAYSMGDLDRCINYKKQAEPITPISPACFHYMRKEVSKWLEIKHYSRFCIRYLCVCAGFRCRIVDIVDRSDRFLAVVNILNVYGWERNWLVRIVCENIYLECETVLCNAAFVLPQPIRSMVLPLMCSCALLILPCRSLYPCLMKDSYISAAF